MPFRCRECCKHFSGKHLRRYINESTLGDTIKDR